MFKRSHILRFLIIANAFVMSAQQDQKPLRYISKDGITVAAYDFKTFEPMLKMANDTTYVVNFWATWCQPCVAELPHFEKLNEKYTNEKVKVILVSLDMSKQIESKLLPFIKKKNLKSKVVFLSDPDANAWIEKVDASWSGAIPATVIYTKSKREFYEKSFNYEELQNELKKFIN